MAYSASLGVLLADQGSLSGTWGTALNNQVFALLDSAIAGRVVIGASGSTWSAANPSIHTLTATDGAANEARAAIIHLVTYNSLPAEASTATLVVPDKSKAYIINNSLTDARNIVKVCTATGASTGNSVFVPKGAVAEVYCDGAGKVSSAQNFIVDGVIDNTTIGATTPSTGKFTTLEATGAATLVAGTINGTTIGASSASTGAFTTVTTTGTLVAGTTLTATGGIIASAIGATTPSTGAFTTLTTTGTLVAGTTLTATGGIIASAIGATTPSTGAFTTVTTTGTLVAGTTLTATGGIIASAIGATTPSTGAFTTLTTSSTIIASGIIKGVWSNTGTANAASQFQVVSSLPGSTDANTIYFVVPS